MNVSREEKKKEAIRRMNKMGIFKETIRQFEEEGYVSISEPPVGAFYWAEGEDLERIRVFEENSNALVYLVIRTFTTMGKMDSFLYVGDYFDEWEMDDEDLDHNLALAYVYNHDDPWCSEIGAIEWGLTIAGGLQRTA